jgi:hypothetical protein
MFSASTTSSSFTATDTSTREKDLRVARAVHRQCMARLRDEQRHKLLSQPISGRSEVQPEKEFFYSSIIIMLAARRPGVNFADAKLTPCGRNDDDEGAIFN